MACVWGVYGGCRERECERECRELTALSGGTGRGCGSASGGERGSGCGHGGLGRNGGGGTFSGGASSYRGSRGGLRRYARMVGKR